MARLTEAPARGSGPRPGLSAGDDVDDPAGDDDELLDALAGQRRLDLGVGDFFIELFQY